MGSYVPSTAQQRKEMLDTVGAESLDALYQDVPAAIRLHEGALQLPKGKTEQTVMAEVSELASENKVFPAVFRGAGSYRHYIPSIVRRVTAKEQFVTAYTPYQPEISQGILQSIFEYQTMMADLMGMDVSNASVYDGAVAAAEAAAMCRERSRQVIYLSAAAHPQVITTVKTYCHGAGAPLVMIPEKDGRTDLEALKSLLDPKTAAGVYLQSPNYYGQLEDAEGFAEAAHAVGAKLILGVNPIAAALLKTPRALGADIAVGEGQPLGMPMGFGGPYLGFMTCTHQMQRKLPGRIVGQTTDDNGNRCFVLTLQAREQHIRREKASSNICSNEALCAMTASVYLAAMGPNGLRKAAKTCYDGAHYLAQKLTSIPGFELKYRGDFFHEFVTGCPVDPRLLMDALEHRGILGGLPVDGGILWCVTECNTMQQIELLLQTVKEVVGQ